jgi:hypothetical protein
MKVYILVLLFFANYCKAQQVDLLHKNLNIYNNVRDFAATEDLNEVFFTIQSPDQKISQIVCVNNGNWDNPVLLPFCDEFSYMEPFLSYDGKRLYFASDRPKSNTIKERSDFDIWYVERKNKDGEWSEPNNVHVNVPQGNSEFYPSLTTENTLYFTMDSPSGMGKDDIYFCRWDGKKYSDPVMLDTAINSVGYEFNAFISKDEKFLLYTKYKSDDGFGSGDLYISYRNENGTWTPAKNLGNQINTEFMEYCPYYDSENGILYFTSKRNNLVPKKYHNTEELITHITEGQNGLSKIYTCRIKL